MRITILALTVALVASGCYSPSLEPCAVSCSATSRCPDDLVCTTDGFCHAEGDGSSCTTLHEVTIAVTGTGVGQITSDIGGLGCAPLCSAQIATGTRVTLTATPSASSRFTGWVGAACSGTLGCSFVVNGPIQIGAGFNASLPLTVAIGGTGGGTVTSAPPGVSCVVDCVAQFDSGTVLTLTAAPDATSRFGSWAQACAGTTGTSCGLTITAPTNVAVAFIRTAEVTVAPIGSGTGMVTSMPTGITCPGTCAYRFDAFASVTLTAAATGRSLFREWATPGPCGGSSNPVCTFTPNADTTAIPTFIERRQVTVVVVGAEGSVAGSVACTAAMGVCIVGVDLGSAFSLDATGTTNWRFSDWTGCPSSTNPCAFNVSGDVTVTATLIEQHSLVAQVAGAGGTVQVNPPGMSCTSACTTRHDAGAGVTIDAVPDFGYRFLDWVGGDCMGTLSPTCTVTMNAAKTATARFLPVHPLTVEIIGDGTAAGTAAGSTLNCTFGICTTGVDSGTVFPLTITPNPGSRLISAVGCVGTAPCNVLMDMARTVTVVFGGGKLVWSKRYGGSPYFGAEDVEAVHVDGLGRVTIAGKISGGTRMLFDGGTGGPYDLTAVNSQRSIMVARYSPLGSIDWAIIIDPTNAGNNAFATATTIAEGANGDVLIGGTFTGALTIGGQPTVTSAGGFDGFVCKIDSTGVPTGLQRLGGTGDEGVANLVASPMGIVDLLVRTTGGSPFSIGVAGPMLSPTGPADIVASVGPGFAHRWSKIFLATADANSRTTKLIVAFNGDPILVGHYSSVGPGPNFGGGALAPGTRVTSFLVRLDDANLGAHLWSEDYGGASPAGQLNNVRMMDAKLAPSGEITVVGWFDNTGGPIEDVSGIPLFAPMTRAGPTDMFIASYSQLNGAYSSSFRFGSTDASPLNVEIPIGLAIDPTGDLSVTGPFTVASITIGPETITNLGGNDVFVLKMTSSGTGKWIRQLGGPSDERVSAIDVSSGGRVAFAGPLINDHLGPNACTFDGDTFAGENEGYVIVLSP